MKGYRFYAEMNDGPKGGHKSGLPKKQVIAVLVRPYGRGWAPFCIPGKARVEAMVGLYDEDNPPVVLDAVDLQYLERHCKRVSESKARELHPRLFERLDAAEEDKC